MLGIRLSEIGKILTAPEWAEYLAADACGIVPDHGLYLEMAKAYMTGGGEEQQQQDLMKGYALRKRMYATP